MRAQFAWLPQRSTPINPNHFNHFNPGFCTIRKEVFLEGGEPESHILYIAGWVYTIYTDAGHGQAQRPAQVSSFDHPQGSGEEKAAHILLSLSLSFTSNCLYGFERRQHG
jgi:hypothetical protein